MNYRLAIKALIFKKDLKNPEHRETNTQELSKHLISAALQQ